MEERNYQIIFSSNVIETFYEKRPKLKGLLDDIMKQEQTLATFKYQIVGPYLELLNQNGIFVSDMNEFEMTIWEDYVMECKVDMMTQLIMASIYGIEHLEELLVDLDDISERMLERYKYEVNVYDGKSDEDEDEDIDVDVPKA